MSLIDPVLNFLIVAMLLATWIASFVLPLYVLRRGLKRQSFSLTVLSSAGLTVVILAHTLWIFAILIAGPARDAKSEAIAIVKRIGFKRFRDDAKILCDRFATTKYDSVDVPKDSWPLSFKILQPELVRVHDKICTIYFHKMRDSEEGIIVTSIDVNLSSETEKIGNKGSYGPKEFHVSWELIAEGIEWYSTDD